MHIHSMYIYTYAHVGFACGLERQRKRHLAFKKTVRSTRRTNDIPPPHPCKRASASEEPPATSSHKCPRIASGTQSHAPQQTSSATSRRHPDASAALGLPQSQLVTSHRSKRTAASVSNRGRPKAKAKARHEDLAALAAVQRLREAQANPL